MNKIVKADQRLQFNGSNLATIMIDKEPYWMVGEVGAVLGYEPKGFTQLIRRE